MREMAMIIEGKRVEQGNWKNILNPYDGTVAGRVAFASPEILEQAVRAAVRAFRASRETPLHERAAVLRKISALILERSEELAAIIKDEAGKPVKLARGEVARAAQTFSFGADETLRMEGVLLPFDTVEAGAGRLGLLKRFPVGPVLAISPFNFPLNLVAHKVAPAIGAGNTIVLKPASQTPMSALALGEICLEAGLNPGVLNVTPCSRGHADALVADQRFKALTFTGSAAVGWKLKSRAGTKKVTLELGGNAAAIVEPDTDLDKAAERLAAGAFAYAGQVCISVQRILVHNSVKDSFTGMLVEKSTARKLYGDPSDPVVICGPMIDEDNIQRITLWVSQAVQAGGRVLCGCERSGSILSPAVLTGVPKHLPIVAEEAFGPVVVVSGYDHFDQAVSDVNDSIFGLQAGVFTSNIEKILRAFRDIEVGAVIHNDCPTFRIDSMPYGGVKQSGFGREGLRYAIEELTEPRLLVIRSS